MRHIILEFNDGFVKVEKAEKDFLIFSTNGIYHTQFSIKYHELEILSKIVKDMSFSEIILNNRATISFKDKDENGVTIVFWSGKYKNSVELRIHIMEQYLIYDDLQKFLDGFIE